VSPRALPGEQRTANSAATQLRRLLHLLPEVSDGAPRKLDDLAARAGTDRKTLFADLRQLAERYDDPGGFVEGVHIYLGQDDVEVSSSHFLRPMRLTLSELRSLELGLAMLAQERPPEERAAIERGRKRLRQAIAKLPDQDLECGWLESAGPTGVDLDTIATLRKAIRERRIVRLNYQSGSATEPTWRDVHPLGLIFHSGMWYLVADGGGEYRFFRADRIHGIQDQDTGFAPPAGFTLDGLIGERRPFTFPTQERLIVRISPEVARWLAEREERVLGTDGTLTAEYPIGDDGWALRHVLRYGAHAQVLAPPGHRKKVADQVRRCLRPARV
jgi:predicted DNA-binding transcriptional regulator YafY